MNSQQRIGVLFVCMGNICRSPTAHGVFRKLAMDEGMAHLIEIDSAGTHAAYHLGEPPDRRARETARQRGIDLSDLRARCAVSEDFFQFDYILAMDQENYLTLKNLCPRGMEWKLKRFLDFAPTSPVRDVPDPYYGGQHGFEQVFDLIEMAARGLLDELLKKLA